MHFSGALVLAHRLQRVAQLLLHVPECVMESGSVFTGQPCQKLVTFTFVIASSCTRWNRAKRSRLFGQRFAGSHDCVGTVAAKTGRVGNSSDRELRLVKERGLLRAGGKQAPSQAAWRDQLSFFLACSRITKELRRHDIRPPWLAKHRPRRADREKCTSLRIRRDCLRACRVLGLQMYNCGGHRVSLRIANRAA